MQSKYPSVCLALIGEDENAFAIVERVQRALREAAVPSAEVKAFTVDARATTATCWRPSCGRSRRHEQERVGTSGAHRGLPSLATALVKLPSRTTAAKSSRLSPRRFGVSAYRSYPLIGLCGLYRLVAPIPRAKSYSHAKGLGHHLSSAWSRTHDHTQNSASRDKRRSRGACGGTRHGD
jgi:hypothetical protein